MKCSINMLRALCVSSILCLTQITLAQPVTQENIATSGKAKNTISYGNNATKAHHFESNGSNIYYEVYGRGEPLLMLHGNGGSIAHFKNQIPYFAKNYRVIVMDNRGQGKSESGKDKLTYELMMEDANALLTHLGLQQVKVLGWSDGGILGLLLAIHHPDKVERLVVMGANLDPNGAYSWAFEGIKKVRAKIAIMQQAGDKSQDWNLQLQLLDLLELQPHIPVTDLAHIQAPTLVMAGDRDVIRDEHSLQIFHALPKSQLAIVNGATHMLPWEKPQQFNQIVRDFFAKPFKAPDTKDLGWFD
jgi:pimeloyl-ACP methyl ester carboxylesterase